MADYSLALVEANLEKECQKIEDTIISYMNNSDTSQWTTRAYKTIKLYGRPSEEGSGTLYRAECDFAVSAEQLMNYCYPLPNSPRSEWDNSIKTLEIIKEIYKEDGRHTKDVYVIRTATGSALFGAISPRDFIDVIVLKKTEKFCSVLARSVVTDLSPPVKGFTRGTNHPCGIIVTPGETANTCKLTYIVQSNIGGLLPQSLVDSAVPSAMNDFFVLLRKRLVKDRLL